RVRKQKETLHETQNGTGVPPFRWRRRPACAGRQDARPTSPAGCPLYLLFRAHLTEDSTCEKQAITLRLFNDFRCLGFTIICRLRWRRANHSRWGLSPASKVPARKRRAPKRCSTPTVESKARSAAGASRRRFRIERGARC